MPTDELCGAIMLPGRHWGPDRCIKPAGHIEKNADDWHFGERGAAWSGEATAK